MLDRPTGNFILDHLPDPEFDFLRPHCHEELLPLAKTLNDPTRPQEHVYFPQSGIVSLMLVLEDGHTSEIAVVGSEGLIGISVFLGNTPPTTKALVQAEGTAIAIPASRIMALFREGGELQHRLLRYTQALFMQSAQTALCNRHHSVDQQLCRWLLLSIERVQGDEVIMTHELIANMLGVRREGVTIAAGKLQDAGIIEYRRGHIRVLDRDGLAARACECHDAVTEEYRRYRESVFG